jgi:hypothetical protein
MRYKNKKNVLLFIAIIFFSFVLASVNTDERYVALPGFACLLMVLWLWMTLWDQDQKIPFFDVGIFCSLATLIYTVYPLINYWAGGMQFGELSDSRLASFKITPVELGLFHLRHMIYLLSFVVFYYCFRAKSVINVGNVISPNSATQKGIIICFLALTTYLSLLQMITGVNINVSYDPMAMEKNWSNVASLPREVWQTTNKLAGILFLFKLAFLLIFVSRCREKKWLIIMFSWVIVELISAICVKGARTGTILFFMAAILFYHRTIKPFTMKNLLAFFSLLFTAFIFFGLYRSYDNLEALQIDLSQAYGSIFAATNEFQALLGTAYDVMQRKENGDYFPLHLSFNDIMSVLPPQQIMPFTKISAADWYLQEIGQDKTGAGYMWGVISQSIVGFGLWELFLRGALLGYVLARFHNWYLKHQEEFLATVVYVYFCLKVYYTFRETTGSLLTNLVWEVIPFLVLMHMSNIFARKGVVVGPISADKKGS